MSSISTKLFMLGQPLKPVDEADGRKFDGVAEVIYRWLSWLYMSAI